MKRKYLSLIIVALFAAPLWSDSFDPDWLNLVTFSNSTGRDIHYIFLSPGDSEYWGPEILGSERVLGADQSLGFWILYPDECNDFDIMAIDEDGNTLIIYDYQVCDDEEVEINISRKAMRDEAPDFSFVTVYIQNETIDVWYVFISPGDSSIWGVDYLDETTTLGTDEYVGFLFPAGSETVSYDLMAVDEEMDTYTFSFGIDDEADDSVFAIEVSDLDVE